MEDTLVPLDRLLLLQTFVRIVEAGSLSAAAVQLETTQPTVSRRLQMLERTLGQRLLQRSTHRLRLTTEGERCLAHARALLGGWDELADDMHGAQAEPRGTLRVVVPHAFGQDQLVGPLSTFLTRHAHVSVEWLLYDQTPDFTGRNLDCAVHVGAAEDPNVIARHVADVPRIVVAAPALAEQLAHDPQAGLAGLPWLALQTYYRDEVVLYDATGRRLAFAIQPRIMTDSLHALRNAAVRGLGAAALSSWLVAPDIEAGRLVALAPGWAPAPLPVYLMYPRARFYPARLRLFLEAMREALPAVAGMREPGRVSPPPFPGAEST
ncbi:LysR family transcriptional regulator [Achromobacter sp. GG226]|uniref:LysR family transcriptional regulator n=1 Tax=Verticiella alkaliphila TaxID=2779529 RepID=UPI001C0BC197|nr:LysR family transcriptional regulator [Verticiella sp. GG226]MBU4609371.1 LysR family transcriptional regulator [Verticiella sp. GG226]